MRRNLIGNYHPPRHNHSYLGFIENNFGNSLDAQLQSVESLNYGLGVYSNVLQSLTQSLHQAKKSNPSFSIPAELEDLSNIMNAGGIYTQGINNLAANIQAAPNGDINSDLQSLKKTRLQLRQYEGYFFNTLALLLKSPTIPRPAYAIGFTKEQLASDFLARMSN